MTATVGQRDSTFGRSGSGPVEADATRGAERWIALTAAPIVGSIVAGMALDQNLLTTAGALAGILAAVVSPAAGLAVLAFMAPLAQPDVVPAPGFNVVLVGAIVLGCIYRLPIDGRPVRIGAPLVLMLAFALYVTVQQLPEMLAGYQSDADHDVGYLYFQLLSSVGAVLAASYILRDRSPYPVLTMAVAGSAMVAIIAILSHGATGSALPLGSLVAPSADLGRATGPFSNPNYLGAYAAVMLVAATGLLMIVRTPLVKGLLSLDGLLLAATVALSLSRGSVVAAIVGIAILLLARGRALTLLLLTGGLVSAMLIYPLFVEWRLETLVGSASPEAHYQMNQSDAGRAAGLTTAPALFASAPVFGIGFGHFVPASGTVSGSPTPMNAHNWFLTVLAEQGLVGVILLLSMTISLIASIRSRPRAPRVMAYGVVGALAAASLFLEPPTSFQMLVTPLIILVAAIVADWRSDLGMSLRTTIPRVNATPRTG